MKKNEIAGVLAVSVIALVLVPTVSAQQTEVDFSLTTDENIFASLSFEGENIWVEIQGITVRQRFENLESAISYVEGKYESRTDQLLNNTNYLKDEFDSFKQEARQKYDEMDKEHDKLEEEHDGLNAHFYSFVSSMHDKIAELQRQINLLWFVICFGLLVFAATVLIYVELDARGKTRRSKIENKIDELEKEIEKMKDS